MYIHENKNEKYAVKELSVDESVCFDDLALAEIR